MSKKSDKHDKTCVCRKCLGHLDDCRCSYCTAELAYNEIQQKGLSGKNDPMTQVVNEGLQKLFDSKDATTKGTDDYVEYSAWMGGEQTKTTNTYNMNVSTCSHWSTPVFYIDSVTYHGGSWYKVKEESFKGLVLNFSGFEPNANIQAPADWKDELSQYLNDRVVISISWPDGAAAPIKPGFWKKIHEECIARGITDVLIYCQGGHGRTGTALAAFLIELSKYFPRDAIEFVRKHYCQECVETKSQENYLEDISRAARAKPMITGATTQPAQ